MIEKQIINRILKSKDISWLRRKPYFDNLDLWKTDCEYYTIIKEHYDKYGEVPSVETFLEKCDLLKLPDYEYFDVTDSTEYLLDAMDDQTTYHVMAPKITGLNSYFSGDQRVLYDKFREITNSVGEYIDSLGANKQYGTDIAEYDPFAPDEANYMPIGFSEIDTYTKGLDSDGELVGIIAKTNQGKTWILLQMAYSAYNAGKNVLIINTEMSKKQVMQRIATLATHISNTEIKENKVSKDDIEKFKDIVRSHENRLTVVDLAELNPTVSTIEMLISNYKCDAVYIDGISYIRPNVDKDEKTYQTLQNVSLALSEIAMRTKTPIVVTVQANRDDKGKPDRLPPRMNDISGAYAINFVCTKVFTFERFDNEIKILLEKSRTSGVGNIWVYDWDIDHGIFRYLRTGSISDTEENDQKSPFMDVRDIVNRKRNAMRNQQPLKRNDNNNIF